MVLPQMVPVQSPCHSRRFASSCRVDRVEERLASGDLVVEYPLHVCKMFSSRSDIMHVSIAWDSFKWDCAKEMLCLSTSGVEFHYQTVLIALAADPATVNLGKANTNFGDMCRHYVSFPRLFLLLTPNLSTVSDHVVKEQELNASLCKYLE